MKTIGERYERLRQKEELLQQVIGTRRTRRGLLNAIREVSKSLFGTLSHSDLEVISKEFDQLYSDNKNLAMVMQNHTKILKAESAIAHVIKGSLNNNTRNLFVAPKLIKCEILIQELHDDIETALGAVNNVKHGIIHPQILTPVILMDTIEEFEAIHRTRYHFDANPESYQHIIDFSEVNVASIKKTLTYIISIPALEKEEYIITHVIPIPQRIQNTHISLISEHEYLFTSKTAYVSTDRETLNKCKSLAEYKICNWNQPSYWLADTNKRDASIIKRHQDSATCNFSAFRLNSESYIPTKSNIFLPNNKLTLDFLCADSTTSIEVDTDVLIRVLNKKLYQIMYNFI